MKKNNKMMTLIGLVMVVMMLASCGSNKSGSLESYMSDNSDIKEQMDTSVDALKEQNIEVKVQDNDIVCNYDISGIDGVNEETIKNEEVVKMLEESIDKHSDTFKELAANMAENTGIKDVHVIVNYCFNDEVIVSRTFTSE